MTNLPFTRQDVTIPSHGDVLSTWLYLPLSSTRARHPTLLLAHGLGAVRTMQLDKYASFFARNGFLVLLFDYRYWGSSTGQPRDLIDPKRQEQDWESALAYALRHDSVDPDRVGIMGSSFSGGHVIRIAANHPNEVKATVSQCPFTDGMASALTAGIWVLPQLAFWGLADLIASFAGMTVGVNLLAKPGQVALMNAPDALPGYLSLLPSSTPQDDYINKVVPARLCLSFPLLRPGSAAAKVQTPILFAVCGKDTVAPSGTTIYYAKKAKKGTIKVYEDVGHFDIYNGQPFEEAVEEYLKFFKQHLT